MKLAVVVVVSAALHGGWLAGCRSAVADFYDPLTEPHGCSGEAAGGAGGAGGETGGAAGVGGQDTCPAK